MQYNWTLSGSVHFFQANFLADELNNTLLAS